MPPALVVAGKDLRLRFRDRTALLVAFLAPFCLGLITTYAFRSLFTTPTQARIAIADVDRGTSGRGLRAALAEPQLRSLVKVTTASSEAGARRLVTTGKVDAAIVLPKGLSDAAAEDRAALVSVIQGRNRPVPGAIAEAVTVGFVSQANADRLASQTASQLAPELNPDRLRIRASGLRLPLQVDDRPIGRTKVYAASYFGPAMAIVFVFFTAGFGARSLWSERRLGATARMQAAPVRTVSVVLGKALSVCVLGICSMLTIWLSMSLVFGATWGNRLAVLCLIGAVTLAALGVTSLLATLSRSEEQAAGITTLVVFVFAIVGGNFVPVFQLPGALRTASAFTPNGWALRAFSDLVALGGGVAAVIRPVLALVVFGLITGSIALARARKLELV